jgi:LacI family transcriptional regulator
MKDVALKAGVSIRTVSRVVNNLGEISEETRQHVQHVIDEIKYRPNHLARGLISGRTLSVGIIVPQISDPFFPEFIQGAEARGQEAGYSVLLCNTNEDPARELSHIETLQSKQVDGIILCGTRLSTPQLSALAEHQKMVMVTGQTPDYAAAVRIPGEEGISKVVHYLMDLGHTRIGHIGFTKQVTGERLEGYFAALEERGLPGNPSRTVITDQVSIENGKAAALKLLDQAPDTTAITCYNDMLAIGAIQACEERGLRVPGDISVTGFDDIPLASLIRPRLTTIRVDRFAAGNRAMDLLLNFITTGSPPVKRTTLDFSLVPRESTGSPAE